MISIKTSFKTSFIFKVVLIYHASAVSTFADESLSSGIDCSEISINYADNPDLTRAERIAAMEAAFYDSVNRFETCNLSNSSQASSQSASQSSNSGSGSGASDESQSTGDNENNNAEGTFESVASSVLTGTEIDIEPPELDSSFESDTETSDAEVTALSSAGANGAIPEDIPEANNDDAVAAQIRLAAELEKDPEKKEKLWDEYRKYKGITKK